MGFSSSHLEVAHLQVLLFLVIAALVATPHVLAILASRNGSTKLHALAAWLGMAGLLCIGLWPFFSAISGISSYVSVNNFYGFVAISTGSVVVATTLLCMVLSVKLRRGNHA